MTEHEARRMIDGLTYAEKLLLLDLLHEIHQARDRKETESV